MSTRASLVFAAAKAAMLAREPMLEPYGAVRSDGLHFTYSAWQFRDGSRFVAYCAPLTKPSDNTFCDVTYFDAAFQQVDSFPSLMDPVGNLVILNERAAP